jgi:excisionase family DNA binding protein
MWNDRAPRGKLLTKGEVALLCRVEIRTVDRWVAAGKIRWYRTPGGRLLFRMRDVLLTAGRRREGFVQNRGLLRGPSEKGSSSNRNGPALRR